MNIISTLILVLQIIPVLLRAVIEVEALIGPGNGAAKKDLVMTSTGEDQVDDKTAAIVSRQVDRLVASLNVKGIFKHSAK